jgi:hypothetical protein
VAHKKITLPLVGLRHRVTPTTLRELEGLTPIAAKLEREPDNLHDENAISVSLMEKPHRDFQIGYVARLVAAEIAPLMDQGNFNVDEAWVTVIDAEEGCGEMLVKYHKVKSSH